MNIKRWLACVGAAVFAQMAFAVDGVITIESGTSDMALPATTNRVVVTDRGIVADGKTDQSAALQKIVDGAPDGTEFIFPAGAYFLAKPIVVKERRHLQFRGETGARLVLHFSPWGEVSEDNTAFACVRSERLAFLGFAFTTDNPPNASGKVVAKDPANGTYDVKIHDEFPITGWEHFFGVDTFDDEGTPDYAIDSYDQVTRQKVSDGKGGTRMKLTGAKYEVIGPQLVRVVPPGGRKFDFNRLRIGHKVLMRYIIYGSTVFAFTGCRGVTLRDIEIERCASFGASVSPPSADFTFERFNMRSPKGSKALYCANADGIHVLGMSGSFVMRDCHFDGLGDDALNIHGKAGELKRFDPATGEAELICRNTKRRETKLPGGWAQAGDTLVVYDAKTCLTKGRVGVAAYADGKGRLDVGAVDLRIGDMFANDRDFPAVLISGCSVRHTRARGILLQSRDMVIENCRFQGLSLPGLLIAPDLRFWNEVGPTVNTEIRNCTFEKCAIIGARANRGALTVKNGHGQLIDADPPGIHRDVRVIGNRFVGCGNCGVFISSTDGVTVKGNVFERCSANRYDAAETNTLYDVWLNNCTGIAVGDNASDKGAERELTVTHTGF